MQNNLFIPKKITVGFSKRPDTYTGKLAFIVYKDEKGNLKKEKSFEGWRDKNIEVIELDNTPESGFILNRDIHRGGYCFSSGRNVIRVYDSRDFEFEITPSNLIGILANSDCSKSEITEKCVYAWNGVELILLPANSIEYQESLKFTEKQANKFSVRDLVKGYVYADKKSPDEYIYIGSFFFMIHNYLHFSSSYGVGDDNRKKQHVFYNTTTKNFCALGSKDLSHCVHDNVYDEYAELLHYAEKSMLTGDIKTLRKINIDVEKIKESLEESPMGYVMLNYSSSSYLFSDVQIRKDESSTYQEFYDQVRNLVTHWQIRESVNKFEEQYGKNIPKKGIFTFEDKLEYFKGLGFKNYVGIFKDDSEKIIV